MSRRGDGRGGRGRRGRRRADAARLGGRPGRRTRGRRRGRGRRRAAGRRRRWLEGRDADGIGPDGMLIVPGLTDLHAHFREPGNEDAETVRPGLAAAAHGGFTTVCRDAQHDPRDRRAGRGGARSLGRRRRRGRPSGCSCTARSRSDARARRWPRWASSLTPASSGSPTTGRRSDRRRCCATRSRTRARSGCRSSTTPRTRRSPRAPRRPRATWPPCWGSRAGRDRRRAGPWPGRSRSSPTSSRDVPGARLHLTHVSTAAALAQVRAAKAAGLPVTCDVTPHHLALTDEWIAGSRRWAGTRSTTTGLALDPWADGSIDGGAVRPLAARQPAAPAGGGRGGRASPRSLDGTADAIATDHAPHTEVDKHVEFGWAANGISGIETAIGHRAGRGRRGRPAAGPGDRGPDDRPGPRPRAAAGAVARRRSGRASRPTSSSSTAARPGRSTPTACGRGARTRRCWAGSCAGVVPLTLAGGRVAYRM